MDQDWTKSKPSKAGWYLFAHNGKVSFVRVEIYEGISAFEKVGLSHLFYTESFPEAYWQGPIDIPDLPKE
jgi:hypothetical protein